MSDWDPRRDWNGQSRPHPQSWLLPLLVLAVLILGGLLIWRVVQDARSGPGGEPRPVAPRGDLAEDEKSTIEVFKAASPSVVHISNIALANRGFRMNPTAMEQGTGSGFIWDELGHVVTNWHVLESGQKFQVTLHEHTVVDAVFVGGSRDHDLAVLKIDVPKSELRPILVGASHDLQVGQTVFAIGNPFGLDQTLSAGLVSGLDRTIESVSGRPLRGVIQTDAAINPGNSGGPLLDSAGRLIGVNTTIVSRSGGSDGIGFAVPVDTVNAVVPRIISQVSEHRASLHVEFLDDSYARRLGQEGALIGSVLRGGAADRAGLQGSHRVLGGIRWGDIIIFLDDKRIKGRDDVERFLDDKKVGDTVKVEIVRRRRRTKLDLILGAAQ